jgi:hypothetical protein
MPREAGAYSKELPGMRAGVRIRFVGRKIRRQEDESCQSEICYGFRHCRFRRKALCKVNIVRSEA